MYQNILVVGGNTMTPGFSETLEKLVKMERQAFGLDSAEQGDGDPMLTMIWWLDWRSEYTLMGGDEREADSPRSAGC